MFANGYVGTNADAVRIRRQEKEREKERKKYEEKAAEKEQAVQSAGLKQFAATTTEVRILCAPAFPRQHKHSAAQGLSSSLP